MTDTRIGVSSVDRPFRLTLSSLLLAAVGCWSFLILGCIAQQADLKSLQKELHEQIKQEKKALQEEVARAREAIAEGAKQTAELKAENQKLFRSRAEINQQFREFREKDLAEFNGKLEQVNKRLEDLQMDMQAKNSQFGTRVQGVETQIQAQKNDLTAHQAQTTALIQQIDQDGASFNQKMTEFQTSLAAFKESLADLGNRFVQEAERDSRIETELSQQLGQNANLSKASIEAMQTHLATNSANIQEVSKSVATLKAAVEQSGTLLSSRLDEEAARGALLETKHTQLEKDVQASMDKMVVSLKDQQQPLAQRMDALQGDLDSLEAQLVTQSNRIQELTQTAIQLREHQDVMGSLLGKRGDDLIQQAGRLGDRLNVLETHQTSLDKTVEANRQNTTRHLEEITGSFSSMNQALQAVKGDLETTQAQLQSVIQANTEFRASVGQVTNRLKELENHQSSISAKIDTDVKTVSTHLAKVNSALAAEKDALSQVNTQINARIDEQERHLNTALASFQSVQGVKEASQDNRAHLNQLTETVNKLREVLTSIGKKFGERVDQHEERLAELAKRINLLQAKKEKN